MCVKFFSLLLWALFITTSLHSQQPALLAEFRFDGNTESAQPVISGIRAENVRFAPDRYGNQGKAGLFNGTNAQITVPLDINPETMPRVTIVLWAQTEYKGQPMVLVSNDNGDFDRTLAIDCRGGGCGWSAFCGDQQVLGYQAVRSNTWSFVALTYDQTTASVTFFVDGRFYEKKGRLGRGHSYFRIGANPSFGGYFSGAMDDVRLYNGALSKDQILQLYEMERIGLVESVASEDLQQTFLTRESSLAEVLVRVGDIDNLGFGWPAGYDPFSGKSTPIHRFPWMPDPADYPGTDRIILGSKFTNNSRDGYSSSVKREESWPQPIKLDFTNAMVPIRDATFQIFIDDFQAPKFGSSFQFRIDGKRIPYIEAILNAVNQTGPIGKIITCSLLPEDLVLLKDGVCTLEFDDPVTGIGDGFAIDFVQLLINRKAFKYTGVLSGRVIDASGRPLAGVSVSSGNMVRAETDAMGRFHLSNVPAGLASLSAFKTGFEWSNQMVDMEAGQEKAVEILLDARRKETAALMLAGLQKQGKVSLYGIHFDSGKSVPKPSSNEVLQELATLLKNNPDLRISISGHTDSDGTDAYNLDLSDRRAKSVRDWLIGRGVNIIQLTTKGYGESAPVGSNSTEQGKALNRRVDIERQ